MIFDPGIKIGAEITHDQMRTLFKCGNIIKVEEVLHRLLY